MMADKDRAAAAQALINWFESQGIMPSDAVAVMTTVMAIEITARTRDLNTLHRAIKTVSDLYALDIAEQLRVPR